MALEKSLIEKMRLVTTKAAIAASKFKGLNDKIGADKAAVDIMRAQLNKLDMKGRVVIGEGELEDEEPAPAGRDMAYNRKDEEIGVEVVDDEELTEAVLQRVVERLLRRK